MRRPHVHLWWQPVSVGQYHYPQLYVEEKSQSIAYHFVREGAARDEW